MTHISKIKPSTIKRAMRLHKLWVESEFKKGKRIILTNKLVKMMDMQDVDFTNANLKYLVASFVDFSYQNFSNKNFNEADFSFANFEHSNFSHVSFDNSTFFKTILNNIILRNTSFYMASFNSIATKRLQLYDADCRDMNFEQVDFSHTTSIHMIISDCMFNDLQANNMNCYKAVINRSHISHNDFQDASLKSSNLYKASLRLSTIIYNNLSGLNLSHVSLNKFNFSYNTMSDNNCNGIDLYDIDTTEFRGLNIISCQLTTATQNDVITYWKDFDIVVTGSFMGTLKELKEEVKQLYIKKDKYLYKKYKTVIKYIETMSKLEDQNPHRY